MKTASFAPALALTVLFAATAGAGLSERFYVARITDRSGEETLRVMSRKEVADLKREINSERRFSVRAKIQAQRAWRDTHERGAFPHGAIRPRKVATVGMSFKSAEAAQDQISKLDERAEKKEQRKKDRDRQYDRSMRNTGIGFGNRHGNNRHRDRRYDRDKRNDERDAEKHALYAEAQQLYEAALQELIAEDAARRAAKEAGQ
jgi:hypothetical protein